MNTALRDFHALLSGPAENWDLFEIALQLSRTTRPDADLEQARGAVEAITDQVRSHPGSKGGSFQKIGAINQVLYEDLGFQGNSDNYYDPDNSYLTEVLKMRKGIPISLAILYQEVAGRIGLQLGSVAMPFHFLLKHRMDQRDIFVDAYNRGAILLEDGCRELLQSMAPDDLDFQRDFLDSVPQVVVVLRMLSNLKRIYRQQSNRRLLVEVLERRVLLLEDPSVEILERGLVRLDLEEYSRALEDLEIFVKMTSNEDWRRQVEEQLDNIRRLARTN